VQHGFEKAFPAASCNGAHEKGASSRWIQMTKTLNKIMVESHGVGAEAFSFLYN
jgi:hypothetical protein